MRKVNDSWTSSLVDRDAYRGIGRARILSRACVRIDWPVHRKRTTDSHYRAR
jgi:hypothetical protein